MYRLLLEGTDYMPSSTIAAGARLPSWDNFQLDLLVVINYTYAAAPADQAIGSDKLLKLYCVD